MKTAIEVIKIYLDNIWHEGDVELIRDYCANPLVRHYQKKLVHLSHEEQIERVKSQREEYAPVFENLVLSSDGEYVTLVYNTDCKNTDWKPSGIEVFKVTDGVITEVWNSSYIDGNWG